MCEHEWVWTDIDDADSKYSYQYCSICGELKEEEDDE